MWVKWMPSEPSKEGAKLLRHDQFLLPQVTAVIGIGQDLHLLLGRHEFLGSLINVHDGRFYKVC